MLYRMARWVKSSPLFSTRHTEVNELVSEGWLALRDGRNPRSAMVHAVRKLGQWDQRRGQLRVFNPGDYFWLSQQAPDAYSLVETVIDINSWRSGTGPKPGAEEWTKNYREAEKRIIAAALQIQAVVA